MFPSKQTINFCNTTIQLFDPNLTTDYLNTTTTFSDPSSVQTSNSSNDDENFKMMGGGGGGGGGGDGGCVLPPPQLSHLKRHHTESDLVDLPSTSSFSLRIKAPSAEILNESLIEEYSTARGRTPRIAHQNALQLAEISPKNVFYPCHALRGPHFPKIKKSLSWSGVMENIKEFNDTSPVSKI